MKNPGIESHCSPTATPLVQRSRLLLLGIFAIAAAADGASAQTTWYVDGNGTPPGTGTSRDPFTSIQYAIGQGTTLPGDTVLVLPGIYVEQLDYLGKDLIVTSRDGAATTIIDGNQTGSVVTFQNSEGSAAVLEGFTITNGHGTVGSGTRTMGGGIYCLGASPTLRELVITANGSLTSGIVRPHDGGGVYLINSSATFIECTISQNISRSYGGGVHVIGGSCTFQDVEILDNERQNAGETYGADHGGGIASESAATYLEGCTIDGNTGFNGGGFWGQGTLLGCSLSNNRAIKTGGGAYGGIFTDCEIRDNSVIEHNYGLTFGGTGGGVRGAVLISCLIAGNKGDVAGGGAYECTLTNCDICDNFLGYGEDRPTGRGGGAADCTLVDCRIYANLVSCFDDYDGFGGGVSGCSCENCLIYGNVVTCDLEAVGGGAATSTLNRCVVYGNTARAGGATSLGSLDRCTVSDNTATSGAVVDSPVAVRNTIVWRNEGTPLFVVGSPVIEYCDIEGGWAGIGNISAPPLFWSQVGSDFHLRPGSPCIDAGDPAYPPDADGSVIEMGAIPFDAAYFAMPRPYCTGKLNSVGCVPTVDCTGSPTFTGADDFHVLASEVINRQLGLCFLGGQPNDAPFYGGTLCVGPPQIRTSVMPSGGNPGGPDCSGSFDYHLTQAFLTAHAMVPGSLVYGQFWYRDPAHPDGTTVGLTDALEIPIGP